MPKAHLKPPLYFSYGQFFIYDQSVAAPGCLWTEKHTAQGFARRESTVCFATLLEFGYADVTYELGRFTPDDSYERVIEVPFVVVTGKVIVDGPEENNVERLVELPKGACRLIAAQRLVGDEGEAIDLFFEMLNEPLPRSTVIVADPQLDIPDALLERAEIA